MTSETPDQTPSVTLVLDGLTDTWRSRLDMLGRMLDEATASPAAAIAECRRLLPLAAAEPRIQGILRLLLAQALIGFSDDEMSKDPLIASIDEGYDAQKLIDRERDPHLWGLCEFNLGVAHERLAAGEQGNDAGQHLKDAALHFDRACQTVQSTLLADSVYRLGIVQMQIGIWASSPDLFLGARRNLGLAAKLYSQTQQPQKEIHALYKSAAASFERAEQTRSADDAVDALEILVDLFQREDIAPPQKLDVQSLLARATIFMSVKEKYLPGLSESAAHLQNVARQTVFEDDPWAWLTAQFYFADACLRLATWGLEWSADPSIIDKAVKVLAVVTDKAIERCDDRFPEHRRELTGLKLASYGLRLSRNPPVDIAAAKAQFQALSEEYDRLQIAHPPTQRHSLGSAYANIANLLYSRDWQGAITEATDVLGRFKGGEIFLQSPDTAKIELRTLSSIGHMAAYAHLMKADDKAALDLSEASKSRFMQLAIAMDVLSGDAGFGREFRTAREDWLRVDSQIKRLDHQINETTPERLPELLNRKRVLTTDFEAVANRLARLLARIPAPAALTLDPASLIGMLPADSAVISVIVTEVGGAGIVLRGTDFQPQGIRFPDLTSAAVQELFAPRDAANGWLASYQRFRRASESAGSKITLQKLSDWSDTVLAAGERLWTLFLGRLHAHLTASGLAPGSQITLILPGVLGTLPISAAWRIEDGRRRFIIEDWTLSCAPSIHVLATAQRHIGKERDRDATLLLVAAQDEISSPFRQTAAKPMTPQAAGIPRVLDAMRGGRFPYWSFGCHGYWDADDPRLSRLIVSEEESLTVADLQSRPLPSCRLALLGACESGVLDPSGVLAEQIGIPSALVEAGVAGVVGTLWLVGGPVDDFLARVLDRHLKGETPAASLRAEQLALVARMQASQAPKARAAPSASRFGPPVELQPAAETFDPSLPAFWAAFQLTGM